MSIVTPLSPDQYSLEELLGIEIDNPHSQSSSPFRNALMMDHDGTISIQPKRKNRRLPSIKTRSKRPRKCIKKQVKYQDSTDSSDEIMTELADRAARAYSLTLEIQSWKTLYESTQKELEESTNKFNATIIELNEESKKLWTELNSFKEDLHQQKQKCSAWAQREINLMHINAESHEKIINLNTTIE